MSSFKGEYEHSLDNKGRVSFPAKFRKFLESRIEDHFTILRGFERCLYLYPDDEWIIVEKNLSNINPFSAKGRMVKRNFLRYAEDISLDKQNRLMLPSSLMAWAGITTKVKFLGVGERIELWSPDVLDELYGDLDQEVYQELFEKVMSNNNSE